MTEETVRAVLRRSWRSDRGGCLVFVFLALAALGLGIYFLVTALGLDQPSRATVEREATEDASRAWGLPLTAACTDPEDDDWGCTLRDAAGRRGWLSHTRNYVGQPQFRQARPIRESTTTDFPVIEADGSRVTTLNLPAGSRVYEAAQLAVWSQQRALTPDATGIGGDAARCADPPDDRPVACATEGAFLGAASVRRLDPQSVEVTTRWRLPL